MANTGGTRRFPQVVADHGIGLFTTLGAESIGEPGDVWAVADLDLTNLNELRAMADGATGAALIAGLYHREGEHFLRRLRGAFAVAIWDRRTQTVLLAVDHFGMRRLHYGTAGGRLAFASRLSALRCLPHLGDRLDLPTVYTYLNFGYVPAPRTIFTGIERLAPGHRVLADRRGLHRHPYWEMAYSERAVPEADARAALAELAERAVERVMAPASGSSGNDTGAFLSGGTDSSTIVGLMSRLSARQVSAFSIGFPEDHYNELPYAEIAARHFGVTHYTRVVTPEAALERLPRLVASFDEPFGNNSALGTAFCASLARESGVTTLVAGDGGDEIFGGNERYRTHQILARYARIPRVVRRRLIEPVLTTLPDGRRSLLGKAQRYVRRANTPNPGRFYWSEFFFARQGSDLLAPDFREAVDGDLPDTILGEHFDRPSPAAELNRLLHLDLKLTIGDNDLLKVTATAEAAGVAVRFPFLDLSLVEFAGTLPPGFKLRGLDKRYLFKQTFGPLLPREVLAKRKHGFGVPTSLWLKTDRGFAALAQDVLLSPRAEQRGYFRRGALEQLFRRHASDSTPYFGDILWIVLMLELWLRRHWDEEVPS